jgi:hypothetical protein
VLRGETVEVVMERVISKVKPPSGAAAAPTGSGRRRGRKAVRAAS